MREHLVDMDKQNTHKIEGILDKDKRSATCEPATTSWNLSLNLRETLVRRSCWSSFRWRVGILFPYDIKISVRDTDVGRATKLLQITKGVYMSYRKPQMLLPDS